MAVAAYVRVSSKAQNLEMQRAALAKHVTSDVVWYEEKASAKTTDRQVLQQLLADVRAGKITDLWVFKLDRLTRTGVADTFALIAELRKHGVTLHAVSDNLCIRPTSDDIVSETLLFALSLAARLERTSINDRATAARMRLEAEGATWGRPMRVTPAQLDTARAMRQSGSTYREVSRALGVPLSTVTLALKRTAA